jgi:phenylalanyl-tRNA synthetase alpha chain
MSDLENLKTSLLAEITAAGDEAAIEAVRVNALGKKGSVSELLKTLGDMRRKSARRAVPRSTR